MVFLKDLRMMLEEKLEMDEKNINLPYIPVAWGELFDKISILEIKMENINGHNALKNISTELAFLQDVAQSKIEMTHHLQKLLKDLKSINEALSEIEDKIRMKEHDQNFDDAFIQLARNVYITNDQRALKKKEINNYLGSMLVEEKSYKDY